MKIKGVELRIKRVRNLRNGVKNRVWNKGSEEGNRESRENKGGESGKGKGERGEEGERGV